MTNTLPLKKEQDYGIKDILKKISRQNNNNINHNASSLKNNRARSETYSKD